VIAVIDTRYPHPFIVGFCNSAVGLLFFNRAILIGILFSRLADYSLVEPPYYSVALNVNVLCMDCFC